MKKIFLFLVTLISMSGMVDGELAWTTPVTISDGVNAASDPHSIIDASGNATAVWVENNLIQASNLPLGGSWSTPVTLSNISNTSSTPRLGVDSSGNVTAMWIENTKVESAVYSSGSWSTETASISGTGASNLSIAEDGSGNVVAVWVRNGYIESALRTSGTWSLVSQLSSNAFATNPTVAISSFGTAIVGWHDVVSGADVIVSNILTISTNTWGTSKNVFTGTAIVYHNYPKIAIDSNGNANIAWWRYNLVNGNAYENVQVVTSSLTQGAAAWTVPSILSSPGILNPADLIIKLKYDISGNAVAIWTNSYDGMTYSIESSEKPFGAAAWYNSILPLGPTLYSLAIDASVASNTVLLASMTWDGSSNLLISSQESDASAPLGQGWTNVNTFSNGSDNGYPSCSITLSGSTFNAVAVWINFNGTTNVINASSGTEAQIAPPTSVSATQSSTNFGVFTDYYNTITWTASTDPDVDVYNIYRNGVFFGQVIAGGALEFVDHNQVNGGAVTYGVAAETPSARQSPTVTFTLF